MESALMRIHWIMMIMLLGVGSVQAESKAACDPWAAKMDSVQGTVEVHRAKHNDWQAVKLDDVFCAGDTIRVGANSRAGVILINNTLLRLDENSVITLTALSKKTPSLLDLVKGIAHFISRVPRSLKVQTPLVNAAIEGTEFVVAVSDDKASVTVFEGKVLTQNDQGKIHITPGETSVTNKGEAPHKVLLAMPRSVVQWALYFPPVFARAEGNIQTAQDLLAVGRVDAATKLLANETGPQVDALKSIIDVVNNEQTKALPLAQTAVKAAPKLAASHIALSYVWQANLNLQNALASAQQAVNVEPKNALAWARVAELQLSTGKLDAALDAANQATKLNPNLSRTQSILGYAYLVRIDIDDAIAAFNKAIILDQADPLPRLGLGLALIRRNHLAEGRRQIEIAASLDPNNAIIRSYLGKAYYEEKRPPLDADQYAMAKQLDPNDPTPYFYDAIRRETENDPVGALQDLNQSIAKNDNRAVYRSSLELDQDEAARQASAARIYQDLGYDQLAVDAASKSLAEDPTNYSAHELLSDAYLSKPRHEIARVSEQLQAKLLNPLNSNPQQPQLNQGSLTLLNDLGPNSSANNEYNKLFQRNGLNLSLNGLDAGKNTNGHEGVLSGLFDWFAFSVGTYHYNTDGFHANNGQDQDLDNYFAQARITNDFSVFLEKTTKNETYGDDYRFDPTNFSNTLTQNTNVKDKRIGFRYQINSKNTLIGTYLDQKLNYSRVQTFTGVGDLIDYTDNNAKNYGIRYLNHGQHYSFTFGFSNTNDDHIESEYFNTTVLIPPTKSEINDSSSYIYSYIQVAKNTELTLGISQEKYKNSTYDLSNTAPKLGVSWKLLDGLLMRLAYFETLRKYTASDATIEPTTISGFNQFYNDDPGTKSKSGAIGFDFINSNKLKVGLEYVNRRLEAPLSPSIVDMSENITSGYLYWTLSNSIALNFKPQRESFNRSGYGGVAGYNDVLTYRYPVGLNLFFGEHFKSNLTATYVEQEGHFIDIASSTAIYGKDHFVNVDLGVSYLLPKRFGTISIGVKNLFNKSFHYEETDKKNPLFAPARLGYARVSLVF